MASKVWWSVRVKTPAPEGRVVDVPVVAWNHHGARSKAVLAEGYGSEVLWVRGPYFRHDLIAMDLDERKRP